MKASELIAELQKLIEKHGDLPVACATDHEPAHCVTYSKESWVAGYYNNQNILIEIEAFEIE